MYGYDKKWEKLVEVFEETTPVKEIYIEMLKEIYEKNGSVIPSRNEKRRRNIKWSRVWKNLEKIKGLNAREAEFAWKLTQDMLPIGSRIHRANVDKECKNNIDGDVCRDIPDITHTFITCKGIENTFDSFKDTLQTILGYRVNNTEIITLSFTHRNQRKRQIAIWFVVKVLYGIYIKISLQKIYKDIVEELEWNLQWRVIIGSCQEMLKLKVMIG